MPEICGCGAGVDWDAGWVVEVEVDEEGRLWVIERNTASAIGERPVVGLVLRILLIRGGGEGRTDVSPTDEKDGDLAGRVSAGRVGHFGKR